MPGFCIFYTERNKQKNFDYEKATLYGAQNETYIED